MNFGNEPPGLRTAGSVHTVVHAIRTHGVHITVAALITALAGGLAAGEWMGWPFLARPVEQLLSDALQRRVSLSSGATGPTVPPRALQVRFLGGLRLKTSQLEIGSPAWSTAPHVLLARDVTLEMRYSDLWRVRRGEPLRIKRLQAHELDGQLERQAGGRVSWHFGPAKVPNDAQSTRMSWPRIDELKVNSGTVRLRDRQQDIDLDVRLSLDAALQLDATGRHQHLPVTVVLTSSDVMPLLAAPSLAANVPVRIRATLGRASFSFDGGATDALHLQGMKGRFVLNGPSMAAVGDLLGVTLPTTAPFHAEGQLARQASTWHVVIHKAKVGASQLQGAFTYDAGRKVPMLTGRLGGPRFMLTDMGPALGTTPAVAAPTASAPDAAVVLTNQAKARGRVLPDRPFDLAALRAMDANVLIDIGELDLNTPYLLPLRPMHAHLTLAGGTLTLRDIQTRMGQGQLRGDVHLDGRGATALWDTRLRMDRVHIEEWLRQKDANEAPGFVSGQLSGHAALQGQGRSTADILSTLRGTARLELSHAKVSHLDMEKAGLDLADILGLMIKGDDMLPVHCAVADLVAQDGVLRPRVMVLDTAVSAVWVEGSLSLASEALALRAVVMPKDFSLASLRMPLQVRGTLARPEFSFEKGTLGLKLASSVLLALVNPFGALIPLLDPGDADAARRGADGCKALMSNVSSKVGGKQAPQAPRP
jgi:AsmA family protein